MRNFKKVINFIVFSPFDFFEPLLLSKKLIAPVICSLPIGDAFPVSGLRRDATTGNASAVRRLVSMCLSSNVLLLMMK